MWKKRTLLFLLCFLFVFQLSYSQDASQQSTQTLPTLSKEIHTQLDSLKQQSRLLTEQLLTVENELSSSSVQVETLKTQQKELTTCLQDTNKKYSDCLTKLTLYESGLKRDKELLILGFTLVVLFIAVRIITLILRVKGVKLPELVNILL